MARAPRKRGKAQGHQRQVSVRGVRRTHPDTDRLSKALMNFALQQAANEAAAEAEAKRRKEGQTDASA